MILKVGQPAGKGGKRADPAGRWGVPATAQVFTMTGKPEQENSFEQPEAVSPVESSVVLERESFSYAFPALSLTVFRIPMAEKEPESTEK